MMNEHDPITTLPTHEVINQAGPLPDYNVFSSDRALQEALAAHGGAWASERCHALGRALGTAHCQELGFHANRYTPILHAFDRYGRRIDEIEFHPAYHELMKLAMDHELQTIAWTEPKHPGHVATVALSYLFTQIEQGVMCPMTMTYAAVPSLRSQANVADLWVPRVLAGTYDPRCIPAADKRGVTIGMAMTEKQGGSDVRSNTTFARPLAAKGSGEAYRLTGHKWFCSAPMSDAFLTLANTDRGLSCFLVPRFRPDGTRNNFYIQRLKDKLGNRSNASSEIEYQDTWAQLLGEEGRGVRTIIDMVHHTRLGAATAPIGMMRQGLTQALHHCRHREAFGKRLVDQPLMRNVLADLALEVEGGVALCLRVARAFDESPGDETAAKFSRIATAVAKYWHNKRAPGHIVEALECHGGAGYVEESTMPRLYREAPLNGIWEGSGNVICLDVLRAMARDPETLEVLLAEIRPVAADDSRVAAGLDQLATELKDPAQAEPRARRITERMAVLLQATSLRRYGNTEVADAYAAARLGNRGSSMYGTLPPGIAIEPLIERADLVG